MENLTHESRNQTGPKPFELSAEGLEFVKRELKRYETPLSATIPCLYKVQEENGGWISEECIDYLAGIMNIPTSHINEVFHFYTMFNKKPVGRYHVQVCCNITCSLLQGRELFNSLCDEFKAREGQITADGKFTFSKVECLGSCGTGPMMQVNDYYVEDLTPDKAISHLKNLE